jgi:hypothetical protein
VPWNTVDLAAEQTRLWEKNKDCFKSSQPLVAKTPTNDVVGVFVCPSGDVQVEVQQPNRPTITRWIGLDTFRGVSSHLIPDIQKAFAEERPEVPIDMLLAQINPVLCQKRLGEGRILRRIQLPDRTCVDEVINTFTGVVVERRPAPCDPNC